MGRACVDQLRGRVDTIVAVDLAAPDIDGAIAMTCDVADRDAVQTVADRAADAGSFRTLIHAAGISPTMGDARRVFDVDLLGTEHLLDAFESLVVAGSAAVCFSSSAAYAIAPYLNE